MLWCDEVCACFVRPNPFRSADTAAPSYRNESWFNKEGYCGRLRCQTRRWEESKHHGTAHASGVALEEGGLLEEEGRGGEERIQARRMHQKSIKRRRILDRRSTRDESWNSPLDPLIVGKLMFTCYMGTSCTGRVATFNHACMRYITAAEP